MNNLKHLSSLFLALFDSRTLVRIIGALCALLVMKALGAHFDFSWLKAFAS
jgi:hypothetical protein